MTKVVRQAVPCVQQIFRGFATTAPHVTTPVPCGAPHDPPHGTGVVPLVRYVGNRRPSAVTTSSTDDGSSRAREGWVPKDPRKDSTAPKFSKASRTRPLSRNQHGVRHNVLGGSSDSGRSSSEKTEKIRGGGPSTGGRTTSSPSEHPPHGGSASSTGSSSRSSENREKRDPSTESIDHVDSTSTTTAHEDEPATASLGAEQEESPAASQEEYHMRSLRKVILHPHMYASGEVCQAVSVLAGCHELSSPWSWVSAFRALGHHGRAREILVWVKRLLQGEVSAFRALGHHGQEKPKNCFLVWEDGETTPAGERAPRRGRRPRRTTESSLNGVSPNHVRTGTSTSTASPTFSPRAHANAGEDGSTENFIVALNAGLSAVADILMADCGVQHLKRASIRHWAHRGGDSSRGDSSRGGEKRFETFHDRGLGAELPPSHDHLSPEQQLEIRREFFEFFFPSAAGEHVQCPTSRMLLLANTSTFNVGLKLIKNSRKIDRLGMAGRLYGEMLSRSRRGFPTEPDDFTYNTLLACCCERGVASPVSADDASSSGAGSGANMLFTSTSPEPLLNPESLFRKIRNPTHISFLGVISALRFEWRRALYYYTQAVELFHFCTQAATAALTSLKIARQPFRAMLLHRDLRDMIGSSPPASGVSQASVTTMKLHHLDKKYYLKLIETVGVSGLDRRRTWYNNSRAPSPEDHDVDVDDHIDRRKRENMCAFLEHLGRSEVREKLGIDDLYWEDRRRDETSSAAEGCRRSSTALGAIVLPRGLIVPVPREDETSIAQMQARLVSEALAEMPGRLRTRPEVVLLAVHVLGRNLNHPELAEQVYGEFVAGRKKWVQRDSAEVVWERRIAEVMEEVGGRERGGRERVSSSARKSRER